MKNDDKLVLIGLDGIIDTNNPYNYTYKNWIIDCFRDTFPDVTSVMTDEDIISKSDGFGYTGELHTLIAGDYDYEIKLLYYIKYVLGHNVSGEAVEQFMTNSKRHYGSILKYDNIVGYVEDLYKACSIGVITDRCWYGCTLISSIMTIGRYSYGQFSYMTRYSKLTEDAWKLVAIGCGVSKENVLVIDTNQDVLNVADMRGFQTYLHKEGDLTSLSTKINTYLSK